MLLAYLWLRADVTGGVITSLFVAVSKVEGWSCY